MSDNIYGIILAGGTGARLWPLSRKLYPKQLLKFNDENTMFQSAFINLVDLIDDKNIISVTNVNLETSLRMQLEELRQKFCRKSKYKILTEPVGRGTAPAIALAAKYIIDCENRKNAILVVTPTDNLVKNGKNYISSLEQAVEVAKTGKIAILGVKPECADTGFGYIKIKPTKDKDNSYAVAQFKEKPSNAKQYVKSKNVFLNSGIFVAKASVFLDEIRKYAPEIYDIIQSAKISKDSPGTEYAVFKEMPDISFDYAVMEKTKNAAMVELDCGWADLGAWDRVYDNLPKDDCNNVVVGSVEDIDCKNSMFYSTSKLVAAVGIKDTVVVETPDAILVCGKNKAQEVKTLYNKLKEENENSCIVHKTMYRPWGYYTVIDNGKGYLTKRIVVNPQGKLSLQRHKYRSEHWVVLNGKANVILNDKEYILNPGECIDIDVMAIHSLQNPYDEILTILEVQKGDILDENDIERLQDIYGRA